MLTLTAEMGLAAKAKMHEQTSPPAHTFCLLADTEMGLAAKAKMHEQTSPPAHTFCLHADTD